MDKTIVLICAIPVGALVAWLMYKLSVLHYKVGYYEQKFRNHKDLFSHTTWQQIEKMMNKKTPF